MSSAANLARRHRAERRFRAYGRGSILFACVMLLILLVSIIRPGISGFVHHEVQLQVDTHAVRPALFADTEQVDYYNLTRNALSEQAKYELEKKLLTPHQLYALAGTFADWDVKRRVVSERNHWGGYIWVWVPLSDNAEQYLKGRIDRQIPPALRSLTDGQMALLDSWDRGQMLRTSYHWDFFLHGDSRAPEAAGFGGSIVGSLLTLLVCLLCAVPIAIAAAITLEEFAGKSIFAGWIEVTINNLAAVPSIIYGLLGLSIYLQLFHLPRGSTLVGGLTRAILILPVMIIASRSAIRAVPPSMRQAAIALGATPLQVVRHHVLPYAWPGIMTGTILSICRAVGETAPLLMIGMVAFVADVPRGITDPATTMPVEIYLWASSPEAGFIERTSSGILVLLVLLLLLNLAAIRLRTRTQLQWH